MAEQPSRTGAPAAGDPDGVAQGTRLVIVRHGEAFSNVGSLIGGHRGCSGLTGRGVTQAEALAERLARTGELDGASAFHTSVLPRAIETASVIEKVIGLGPASRDCALCERHPGEADGLTWAEYEVRYRRKSLPGEDPEMPLSPGGESWVEFLDRAAAALTAVAKGSPGGLVVVVAHGGVIDASLIRFLELPAHGVGVRLHPEHTSLTEWQHTGTRWRLVRYNDAAHLAGPELADLRPDPPPWVFDDTLAASPRPSGALSTGRS